MSPAVSRTAHPGRVTADASPGPRSSPSGGCGSAGELVEEHLEVRGSGVAVSLDPFALVVARRDLRHEHRGDVRAVQEQSHVTGPERARPGAHPPDGVARVRCDLVGQEFTR